MKRAALLVAMAVFALGGLTGCPAKKERDGKTPDMSNPSAQVQGIQSTPPCPDCYLRSCPFIIRNTKENIIEKDSKSQSPALKGKCLEPVDYVVETQPGEFRARLMDTFALEGGSRELGPITLRSAGKDETNPVNSDVPLYEPLYKGVNLCEGEAYAVTGMERTRAAEQGHLPRLEGLRGKAMLVPGYWKQGRWQAPIPGGKPVSTLACMTGVIAKCVHWGYIPGFLFQGNTDLGPFHHACVQAARALYTEDKTKSFTCSGTEFDIYDALNIQRKTMESTAFESLWNEEGLVCIARSRWGMCEGELQQANVSLAPGQCTDPVKEPGQVWQASTPLQRAALIAISSAPGRSARACPTQLKPDEACQTNP